MRLRLPQTGLVFPDRFIPLAEKYGYIHRLSMIILNKTCRQIKQMQDEGYQISSVSVNPVSYTHLLLQCQHFTGGTFMQDRFERFVVSITELHRYLQKLKELEMGQMDLKAGYTMCPVSYTHLFRESSSSA